MAIDPTPEVRKALRTRLEALADVPKVAWEARPFTRTRGTPFLRERLHSNGPKLDTIGPNGRLRTTGTWFLDVCYPAGVGVREAETFAATLMDWFPPGLELTESGTKMTVRNVGRAGVQTEPDWVMVPVTVQWYADTINTI